MKHAWRTFMTASLFIPLISAASYAQDTPTGDTTPTTLERQIREMEARHQAEMDAIKAQMGAVAEAQPLSAQEMAERIEDIEQELDEMRDLSGDLRPGTTSFLLTGYAHTTFKDKEGSDSSFDAAFFPIFLWKMNDQIFFASELEVELESDGGTKVVLEFLEMDFVVNDYLTFRAGKFLSPLSTFKENLHPAWINKLPDQPLFASGDVRLIPTSSLGIEARGAFPAGNTTLNYSVWIVNGFDLKTGAGDAGLLSFSNFSDANNNKAIGGRIGFLPIPEVEIFYAFDFADVSATGSSFGAVDAFVSDIGVSYVAENEWLGGRVDARFEYVLSDVDDVDFGGTIGLVDNERQGGYAQVAYRPTMAGSFLKDLEGVIRYDFIDQPTGAPSSFDEDRWTVGVNYWLSPSAVVKLAYQFDNVDDPTGTKSSSDAIMAQFALGF